MSYTYKMLIAGHWTGSARTQEVRNPFSNEVIGTLPVAGPEEVNEAVSAAEHARAVMKNLPAHERARILMRTAEAITEMHAEMTRRIVLESGKAWKWAHIEVDRAVENLRFAAEEAKRIHGETVPMDASAGSENRIGYWLREPVGVIAAITPFNFPLNLVVHKVAPAIAAGNSVVLKPAPGTPGPAQELGRLLLEAGLPEEALNIIHGGGPDVGEALIRDDRVAMVTFTGSVPAGKKIKEASGLKKITLELGSNSGTLVDASADIDLAVQRCIMGSFAYNGQVCISVQRIYIHREVFEEFLDRFTAAARKLIIGDPMDPTTDITPMISEQEAERAEAWVTRACAQGARAVLGGKREGRIFHPTVLIDVRPEMEVVCNEVFAPVVSLIPVQDFEQGISLLDDSQYGLQAGIFTRDIHHAFLAIKALNAGGVMINDVPTYRADHMPYGGNKNSGIGREGARFAIEEMTNIKFVCFNL